jgi:hypothetical protein
VQKPKERTLIGPAKAPFNRATSSRNGGRNHLGTPGEIKSEWWPTSSRIRGRLPPESAVRGDVLAYFGYPQAHEDDAVLALHAGLAIIMAVEGLASHRGFTPRVRIGIATGLVVVGELIGEGTAQERSVVGETPNLAARLQEHTDPGTLAIDTTTRRLAGRLFEYRSLGEVSLKGFAEPTQAWQVTGLSAVLSRFDARHDQTRPSYRGFNRHGAGLLARRQV